MLRRIAGPLVATAALVAATPAAAAAPFHGTFGPDTQSFIDTETCGFPIQQTQTESGDFTVYFKDGVRTKAIVHNTFEATLTANGTTLVERDRWNPTFYGEASEQAEVDAGNLVHIQGPGNLLIHEAGKIVSIPTSKLQLRDGPPSRRRRGHLRSASRLNAVSSAFATYPGHNGSADGSRRTAAPSPPPRR
jgi:hypothetical protein